MQAFEISSPAQNRPSALSLPDAASTALRTGVVDRPRHGIQIRRIQAHDLQWLPALADLLIDSVHQSHSSDFLAPLSRYAALEYWHGVYAKLGAGHALWMACEGGAHGPLHGAVQLKLAAHAHHRGEVQRLMVHSREQGRGIGSQLMAALESTAASWGRHLLVLDAPTDSASASVFRHLGWRPSSEAPGFSSLMNDARRDAAMLYKRLRRQS
ncbi:MAG: GNAT family N-acetyltransferase [Paucibacter sp.]|nr:GNAT family N-acetyltransferase [Roseateles sp.]